MSKKLHCEGCNTYLGIIEKGSLHPNILFLCKPCNIKRLASDMVKSLNKQKSPSGGLFDGLFGDILKGRNN